MKKLWIMTWMELGLLMAAIVLLFCRRFIWLAAVVLLAGLILLGLILAEVKRQQKIQQFLLMESKKKNSQKLNWDEREQEKLSLIRKRVEYNALQNQIDPHFLYNTLDSIRSRALLDENTEIASMTEILSKFFRYCISHSESLVQIREEVNHIKDYYYIQKYRFEDRFDMEIEAEGEDIYDYYIPKMTIQPLVENAMIHGLEKVNRKGHLILRLHQTDRKVVITVSDNGMGMKLDQLEKMNQRMSSALYSGSKKGKHNSIAVANVNARIKITFGEEYGIHYQSWENEGTDAIITIPKIDDFVRNKYENELRNEP